MTVLPAGLWHVCIYDLLFTSICEDSICIHMNIGFERHSMIHALNARQFNRAESSRMGEFYFYPIRLISFFNRKKVDVVCLTGHQLFPGIFAIAFHFFQFQWFSGISFWSGESQYGDVTIVAPVFLVGLWYGKVGLNIFSCNVGATINNGTHGVFRLDPRTA